MSFSLFVSSYHNNYFMRQILLRKLINPFTTAIRFMSWVPKISMTKWLRSKLTRHAYRVLKTPAENIINFVKYNMYMCKNIPWIDWTAQWHFCEKKQALHCREKFFPREGYGGGRGQSRRFHHDDGRSERWGRGRSRLRCGSWRRRSDHSVGWTQHVSYFLLKLTSLFPFFC